MSIETYNRLRNVDHVTVSHNYAITGGRNEELIDKILNIRSFTGYKPKQQDVRVRKG